MYNSLYNILYSLTTNDVKKIRLLEKEKSKLNEKYKKEKNIDKQYKLLSKYIKIHDEVIRLLEKGYNAV